MKNLLVALLLASIFLMTGKAVGGDSFLAGWFSFGLFSTIWTIYQALGIEKKK